MSTIEPAAAAPAPVARFKPSVGIKMLYGMGQMVQSGGFDTALVLTFFYYTAVLGLSGGLAGLAVGLSLCIDAVMDPLIGSWSDNIKSRWGRRLPLMVLAIPAVALSIGLLFSPPHGLHDWQLFAWFMALSVATRCSVSLFNVPYIALGAELADGYVERSRVVVYRTVLGLLATVFVGFLAYSVFLAGPDGLIKPDGYPAFGWAMAALLTVGMVVSSFGVARYAAKLPQVEQVSTPLAGRLPGEIAEIFRNRSFRILFFACLFILLAVGLNATFNNHVHTFVWKLHPDHLRNLLYVLLLAMLAGVPMAPVLSRWFEKRLVVVIGVMMLNIAWLVVPLLRAFEVVTVSGDAAMPWLLAGTAFAGFGIGMVLVCFPSMMADAADEHELLFGRRREGLYFAGLAFVGKAGSGLGAVLAGIALQFSGLSAQAGHVGGGVIAEGSLVKLVLAAGPVPAIICTLGVVLMWPYAITRKAHDRISADLRLRHAADQL